MRCSHVFLLLLFLTGVNFSSHAIIDVFIMYDAIFLPKHNPLFLNDVFFEGIILCNVYRQKYA